MKALTRTISSFLTGAGLLLLFTACPKKAIQVQKASWETLPRDFTEFYTRFHQDTLFQMEHIQFPLEGKRALAADTSATAAQPGKWQREEWTPHKPLDPDAGFRQQFYVLSENLVEEELLHFSGNYAILRRWSRSGDGWNLIYYSGLVPAQK